MDRSCLGCGVPLVKRPGEHQSMFAIRLHCNQHCYDVARARHPVNPVKHGRNLARYTYPVRPCESCGAESTPSMRGVASKIARHHRDGDQTHNEPANIAFLCKPCHDAEHRVMRANGIGRKAGGHRPRINALHHDRALERFAVARRLRAEGLNDTQIGRRMGFDPASVSRWFHKYGQEKAS